MLIDEADIADAKAVRANIAAGRDELVPGDVVKRLVGGDNPVRVWREHRGLSARALAEAAGMSAAYVSEIEAGKKEASLSVMKRIAEALKVEIGDIAG